MPLVKDPKDYLEVSLREFFDDDENKTIMLKIVHNELMSLRTLDWFVSNYSKKKNIMFTTSSGRLFNVFMEYKSQLKSYSKRMFDPFNRGDRITITDLNDNEISTTCGQLNFFRWVIKNDIVNECLRNIKEVEEDMTQSMKQRKTTAKPDEKRKELSKAAIKSCQNIQTHVTITFS
jgi:hypothetical protein